MKPVSSLPAAVQTQVIEWALPQKTLPAVPRWSKYLADGCRRQDTLQHSYSIRFLAMCVLPELAEYAKHRKPFRPKIVEDCLIVHDLGEGIIKQDTHYIDKNVEGDLAECLAFFEAYPNLPEHVADAYLLQFVGKPDVVAKLPDGLRQQAEAVAKAHHAEYEVFDAIERYDYLLYAIEQHMDGKGPRVVVQTIRNQMPHFERLLIDLPGFREVLFTHELEAWCRSILAQYEDEFIEQKGET